MKRALVLISLALLTYADPASNPMTSVEATDDQDWFISALDDVDVTFYIHYSDTSISVDQQENVHISYRGPDRDLRYATNRSGLWQTETVYNDYLAIARENAIAVDSSGEPHISFSYRDGNAEDLKYASRNTDGTWEITAVYTTNSAGMENSIALGGNDAAHISHWQWNGSDLLYSTNQSGDWVTETLGKASWDRTAIALDSSGGYHIVYRYGSQLLHTDPTRTTTVIDPSVVGLSGPSIAIDANGHLHVSYGSNGDLRYATNASGIWTVETVTAGADPERHHAIAVDAGGNVHLSYRHQGIDALVYANNLAGSWTAQVVDGDGDVGYSNAIAIDVDGEVHISYRRNNFPNFDVEGIWSAGSGAFLVGEGGKILFTNDGASWTPMSSSTSSSLHGVWGSSQNDVFAVGSSGTIVHYDGNAWSAMSSGTFDTLNGVWGESLADVFAVGSSGTIVHYDGSAWSSMESGTSATLYGVWGSSSNDVFAVGSSGTVLRYDGGDWSPMSYGTTATLYGVWGSSPSDVFAVGSYGEIRRYDGSGWLPMSSGTTATLAAIGGNSSSDILASGSQHTLRLAGEGWEELNQSELRYATNDLCRGDDAAGDSDSAGVCDDLDLCVGNDLTGDSDSDGVCADRDCDDGDPNAAVVDGCGVCGGDNSSCGIFFDGFESGDTTAWSHTVS